MILGLDVSTSKTGWCILDSDGSLIRMGCAKSDPDDDLFEKAEKLVAELKEALSQVKSPVEIVIEEPLLRFAKGMSSASTLLTLNRYNGMVTHACWKSLGVKPTHLNVIFARRRLGIKKEKGANVKEVVMDWVSRDVPEYEWPTKSVTRGKKKGQVVFQESCFDVADAYVMAKAAHVNRVAGR
jgi:Holliday junction resolvasome RuvABC endonuclease subunit